MSLDTEDMLARAQAPERARRGGAFERSAAQTRSAFGSSMSFTAPLSTRAVSWSRPRAGRPRDVPRPPRLR